VGGGHERVEIALRPDAWRYKLQRADRSPEAANRSAACMQRAVFVALDGAGAQRVQMRIFSRRKLRPLAKRWAGARPGLDARDQLGFATLATRSHPSVQLRLADESRMYLVERILPRAALPQRYSSSIALVMDT